MTSNDAEREVFARIRRGSSSAAAEAIAAELASLSSLATPAAPTTPTAPTGPAQSSLHTDQTLLEDFLAQLERNGCTSAVVPNRSAAVVELSRVIAARYSQRRIVTGQDPRLAALPWRDGGLLPRFGTATADDKVSVSYAVQGIAETGSLVLWADKKNPALNNLLVESHLILLDQADLHASMNAVWRDRRLEHPDTRPRGIMMISGPSSTADIAMQLVWGAHGPKALHVVVIGRSA